MPLRFSGLNSYSLVRTKRRLVKGYGFREVDRVTMSNVFMKLSFPRLSYTVESLYTNFHNTPCLRVLK